MFRGNSRALQRALQMLSEEQPIEDVLQGYQDILDRLKQLVLSFAGRTRHRVDALRLRKLVNWVDYQPSNMTSSEIPPPFNLHKQQQHKNNTSPGARLARWNVLALFTNCRGHPLCERAPFRNSHPIIQHSPGHNHSLPMRSS